jgi:hypothetical protein
MLRALDTRYQYTALSARSAISVEVCDRAAHCEVISDCQPNNLSTFLLLAAPTRPAHARAGFTGSVQHKLIWCKSVIDQFEKYLTAPQKFATSSDLPSKYELIPSTRGKMILTSGIQ